MIRELSLVWLAIACLTATSANAEPMQIKTQKTLNDLVVDRTLVFERSGDEIVVNSAGQITGTVGGQKITASKWIWDGTKFCRALKTAERDFPSECQNVMIDGSTVTFGQTPWMIK